MPLIKSNSKHAMSENIRELRNSGYPEKQAVAIAYNVKRKGKKGKTSVKKPAKMAHASSAKYDY